MPPKIIPSLAVEPLNSPDRISIESAAPGRNNWLADLSLTLPFLLLFWINLAHHEMWLDELNAWGLSAASPTLRSLFANVHYEGHPWLWYLLLWFPARFTHAPVVMKWIDGLIGTASYLVVGLLSPFTRLQKVLVFLSYFLVFEYTVISRTYGPMLLFALLYAWRRSSKPLAIFGNLVVLGALASSDLLGIMLSCTLLLEYAASQWTHRREFNRQHVIAGAFCYLVLLGISIQSLRPAPDISWATTGYLFQSAGSLRHFVHAIGDVVVGAWWPFADRYPHQYWHTDVRSHPSALYFVPFVLAGMYWIFRKQRNLLLLVGSTLLLALAFAHLVYIGRSRHWGITVMAFLIALWILCSDTCNRQQLSRIAYIFLAVGALKGVAAVAASWTHPFSETGRAADWIRANHLANEPIAGASDYDLAGVAEQLQRPVYFLNCDCVDTYMKFSHRRDEPITNSFADRIERAFATLHASGILLVMDHQLSTNELQELRTRQVFVRYLADFTGSEDKLSFYIYQAEKQSP